MAIDVRQQAEQRSHVPSQALDIREAAAAANILPGLSGPLQSGRTTVRDLAAVQRRREWSTRITQAIVTQIQHRVVGPTVRADGGTRTSVPPATTCLLRLPLVQRLPLTWVAHGVSLVHLSPLIRAPSPVTGVAECWILW